MPDEQRIQELKELVRLVETIAKDIIFPTGDPAQGTQIQGTEAIDEQHRLLREQIASSKDITNLLTTASETERQAALLNHLRFNGTNTLTSLYRRIAELIFENGLTIGQGKYVDFAYVSGNGSGSLHEKLKMQKIAEAVFDYLSPKQGELVLVSREVHVPRAVHLRTDFFGTAREVLVGVLSSDPLKLVYTKKDYTDYDPIINQNYPDMVCGDPAAALVLNVSDFYVTRIVEAELEVPSREDLSARIEQAKATWAPVRENIGIEDYMLANMLLDMLPQAKFGQVKGEGFVGTTAPDRKDTFYLVAGNEKVRAFLGSIFGQDSYAQVMEALSKRR